MAPVGSRIVLKPFQGIIDADCIKQGQRKYTRLLQGEVTIGDFIANMGELGRGKVESKLGCRHAVAAKVIARFQYVRVGDFLRGQRYVDVGRIIAHQMGELFHQIAFEVGWLGDRGGIDPGGLELCIGPRK